MNRSSLKSGIFLITYGIVLYLVPVSYTHLSIGRFQQALPACPSSAGGLRPNQPP